MKPVRADAGGKACVVRGVVHGLMKGRWSGGDRLTELEAAELFKLSRTPVREALLELASMGLIELRRNCGAVFNPFGEVELRELYGVRTLLEVEATRLATPRMEAATIETMRAGFEELRQARLPDRAWKRDRELHAAIAQAAGNARLAGEIERYGELVQTIREAVGSVMADIHSTSVSEHLRILRALQLRDADSAAEAMRRHLLQAAESAVAALRSARDATAGRRRKTEVLASDRRFPLAKSAALRSSSGR